MWRIVPPVRAGPRPKNIPWIVADKAFDSMDAPIKRDTGPHTPMPYNKPQRLDHEPATTTKYVRRLLKWGPTDKQGGTTCAEASRHFNRPIWTMSRKKTHRQRRFSTFAK